MKLTLADFQTLRLKAKAEGLFERTYGPYALTACAAFIGMAASLYLVTLTDNFFIQIANAVLFAFASVQMGMIGHDLSHGAVFRSERLGRFVSAIMMGLVAGLSESQWREKHNEHHKHPNHADHDPDLGIPFVFDERQIETRSRFSKRWILPYQHVLFFLALPLLYPALIGNGMRFVASNVSFRTGAELALAACHFVALFWFVFAYLPVVTGICFLMVTFASSGAYLGVAFAPNHKGEAVLMGEEKFTWVHQITLTRNIFPSKTSFYLLGGLGFQIEHHLFPDMPRYQYWKARAFVKEFCRENGIEYHETTWWGSMREIYASLKEQARAASRQRALAPT